VSPLSKEVRIDLHLKVFSVVENWTESFIPTFLSGYVATVAKASKHLKQKYIRLTRSVKIAVLLCHFTASKTSKYPFYNTVRGRCLGLPSDAHLRYTTTVVLSQVSAWLYYRYVTHPLTPPPPGYRDIDETP
jgi:hypothetical protein